MSQPGGIVFVGIAAALAASLLKKGATVKPVGPMDKRRAFVLKIWEAANRLAAGAGWPRDLLITVAAHESGWGRSGLTRKANNLFGFKVSASWLAQGGEYVEMDTWEVLDGKNVTVKAKFRKYDSWEGSIADYIRLISTSKRYRKAYAAARKGDFKGYFNAVKEGGYATDPAYPGKLARVHGDVEAITT